MEAANPQKTRSRGQSIRCMTKSVLQKYATHRRQICSAGVEGQGITSWLLRMRQLCRRASRPVTQEAETDAAFG